MEGPVLRDRKVHLTEKLSYGKNRFEHHARDDVSNFYISIVSLFYNLIDFYQKRMFRAVSFLPFHRTNEKIPLFFAFPSPFHTAKRKPRRLLHDSIQIPESP